MNRPIAAGIVPAIFCLSIVSYGQSATGTLTGMVEDQNGAIVPGANIALINKEHGSQRLATTNSDGVFVFVLVPAGKYSLTATRDGFAPMEIKTVLVNVNDQTSIRIALTVGSVSQSVEIVDGAPLINELPAVTTVVDRQFVENLPLNGKSFHSLIALTPGTVGTKTNFQSQGQFSINGQRANANYFTVDGVSANLGVGAGADLTAAGSGSLPATSSFGGTSNLVSIEALQEFRIQTSSYAAEFGRTPGGQVQIVTRSGTNDFHGSLFEYLRNDALDATDWFANATKQRKPALRQNDFGGTFSGPVLLPRFGEGGRQPGYDGRNRTLFFFSYEGLRLRLPQTVVGRAVPNLTVRNTAPIALRPFLDAYPLPNGRDLGGGLAEVNATFSDPSTLDATSIRIDHHFGPRVNLFGRYNYAPSKSTQRTRALSTIQITPFRTETLTVGSTQTLTTAVVNELLFNWSRNKAGNLSELDGFMGAVPPDDSLLFPSFASREDSFYGFNIRGPLAPSFAVGRNAENRQRQINLIDNLSISKSAHQLKFGLDYRRLNPEFAPLKYTLQPIFEGTAGVLSGNTLILYVAAHGGARSPLFQNFSVYGQDTWRVTNRFTLTYGLRWEVNPPPAGEDAEHPSVLTGIDNPATMGLAPFGTPLWKTTYNNFAPRIGFAYDLSRRAGREIVLRGGFGVFYDLGTGIAANAFSTAFPFLAERSNPSAAYPVTDPALVEPPPLTRSLPTNSRVHGFDPKLKLPYVYQWNFAVEQSLGANQAVSASYVAAVGRRLLRREQFAAPNANFTQSITITRNRATSDYHALQTQFRRRLARNLQALASYTWSHSIDISSSDSSIVAPVLLLDPQRDRGPSDFDVRHSFTGAVSYNFPQSRLGGFANAILRDWSIDGIVTARSATPVNVITGTDVLGLGLFDAVRPNLSPDIPIYIEDTSVPGGRRFNNTVDPTRPGCKGPFCPPAAKNQGSLGRNALRGFSVYQLDFA
ncbi:MAG TPA: TonB-dependent receptor, partial [Pyrinomonadaceae bacterium]|nr:TonB-dependent receptor [Pyrinomonadaceae bacterium]